MLTQTIRRYYQPNPNALTPFTPNTAIHDPDFASSCSGSTGNCALGWGLRVVNSTDLHVYGAGLYSFFNNYDASKFKTSFLYPDYLRKVFQSSY